MGSGNYQVTDIADNLGTHHAQDAFEKKRTSFSLLALFASTRPVLDRYDILRLWPFLALCNREFYRLAFCQGFKA